MRTYTKPQAILLCGYRPNVGLHTNVDLMDGEGVESCTNLARLRGAVDCMHSLKPSSIKCRQSPVEPFGSVRTCMRKEMPWRKRRWHLETSAKKLGAQGKRLDCIALLPIDRVCERLIHRTLGVAVKVPEAKRLPRLVGADHEGVNRLAGERAERRDHRGVLYASYLRADKSGERAHPLLDTTHADYRCNGHRGCEAGGVDAPGSGQCTLGLLGAEGLVQH
mmetsp:Transcript_32192/g.72621  ORF Transcript_32192/g.72621 Transcript_32192/m.72621 type:complete len:221 (-) Transcript_32192:239-901(-)